MPSMSILIGILTIVAAWMFWPILWRVGAAALAVAAVVAFVTVVAVSS
jgi:hypothetical protein